MKDHYVPISELKLHKASMTCECRPKIQQRNGRIVAVHRSVTGQEQLFKAKTILGLTPAQIQLVKIEEASGDQT